MAIKRATISLPEDLAGRLRADAGDRSVSAHVAAIIARLDPRLVLAAV